ncbi:aminotransferase class IV [Maribacter sp. LLG6340-A2]|uniref:aminotransferase class IV n=1 Tax=Maribacter sp. LLG6340-A2 TaxID=3160834 RepID=UPI003865701A
MYPLFESVHISNGKIQNGLYHEKRFTSSYIKYFSSKPTYSLFEGISISNLEPYVNHKLRIAYGYKDKVWKITPYTNSLPTTLQLVHDNTIFYGLKFNDREQLNALYKQKNTADDVLIINNGTITDATYSNILFTDGKGIFTPSTPLLNGTCRARLLADNIAQPKIITPADLQDYQYFQLINALNDFNTSRWIRIENIFPPK